MSNKPMDKSPIIRKSKENWYAMGSIILYFELIIFGILASWIIADFYMDGRITGMFGMAWIYLISVKLRKELTYVESE